MAFSFDKTGAEIQTLLNFVQTKVETVLFSGDTQGDVALSESAANFSELVIYYEGYNGSNPQTMTIDSPNGRSITLSLVEPNGSGEVRIRLARYNISDNAMICQTANQRTGAMVITSSSATWTDGNVIHITKVVGRG